jgi:hypothetical protein
LAGVERTPNNTDMYVPGMSVTPTLLPAPVRAHVDAFNALDREAILATFTHDALVNDLQREYRGIDVLGRWVDHEILGYQMSVQVVETFEQNDVFVLRGRYDGNFDRVALGLPADLILTNYITLRADKISTMIIVHNKPGRV